MSIREITDYSDFALGAGCFFGNGPKIQISDPKTGHLRHERVFTSDRLIEIQDEGIVEFSERAAFEIAHAVGWVSPEAHNIVADALVEMERERGALAAELGELRAGVAGQLKLGAEAQVQLEQTREELEELRAKLRSEQGARGGLTRKVNELEGQLKLVQGFGDD